MNRPHCPLMSIYWPLLQSPCELRDINLNSFTHPQFMSISHCVTISPLLVQALLWDTRYSHMQVNTFCGSLSEEKRTLTANWRPKTQLCSVLSAYSNAAWGSLTIAGSQCPKHPVKADCRISSRVLKGLPMVTLITSSSYVLSL